MKVHSAEELEKYNRIVDRTRRLGAEDHIDTVMMLEEEIDFYREKINDLEYLIEEFNKKCVSCEHRKNEEITAEKIHIINNGEITILL